MSLLTPDELRAELQRLAQVYTRLVTMKPQIINDDGLRLWERAASEREGFELKVRLALAITEEGQRNRVRGKYTC